MKRVILVAAMLAALAGIATAAVAATGTTVVHLYRPTLEVRSAEVGCHTWSLNGGPASVEQFLRLRVGQSLEVVNHDICAHKLVETSGGTLALSNVPAASAMRHVQVPGFAEAQPVAPMRPAAEVGSMSSGAGVLATFTEPGSYEFVTHEDTSLFGGLPTLGPDNQLVLHVQVIDHHNDPLD